MLQNGSNLLAGDLALVINNLKGISKREDE